MPTIFYAADSTVQYNSIMTYPQTGMGQVLPLVLKPEVVVKNHAKNGRSTKSFIDQGRLDAIEKELSEGDFLFIQFGHNDEKKVDPDRYTTPRGTFVEKLKIFVDTAKRHGATPVLITPIERRCFLSDGTLGPGEHGEYVAAAKDAAKEWGVACVDLNAMSREVLSMLGPVEAARLYVHVEPGIYPHFPNGMDDMTHLSPRGAVQFCTLLARGLWELGGIYADLLMPELVELFDEGYQGKPE